MATRPSQPPVRQPRRELIPARTPGGSDPAQFGSADAACVQALAAGNADSGQQKRALDWILKKACGLPTWAYRDSQRETDVALGRQFVGQQIMGLLNLNVSTLKKRESVVAQRGEETNG